jgi:DNA-binding transcriptional ArsR family regulator
VLAHPHRLRMLLSGNYTVGNLARSCELPAAMASEHLRLMQRYGFLDSEKDGRKVFYRVVEPHLKNTLSCIEERFEKGHRRLVIPFLATYIVIFRYGNLYQMTISQRSSS